MWVPCILRTPFTWEYWKRTPSRKGIWKEKKFFKFLGRSRKRLETKLYNKNLIKGINTLVVLVRYSEPFLKWTRKDFQKMVQSTRTFMTMYKALHPRYDIDRHYVVRKEGRWGLASFEDNVDALIRRLEDHIKKKQQRKTDNSDKKQPKQRNDQENNKNLGKKNGKKNKYMDISNNKPAKSHTRKLGHG